MCEGGWILDIIKNYLLLYISQMFFFLLIICNVCMFFTFVLVYVSVCLFVHQYMLVHLSVSYGFKCFLMRPSNGEGSQLFKFHFPCNKGERSIYILSLESAISIQKPRNFLKVAYHPVSCLLHHYTFLCFKYALW